MDFLDDDPCTEILPPDVWMHKKDHSIAGVIIINPSTTFQPKKSTKGDSVHSYACEILSLGLLYAEFQDAIREGDGLRVLRCWRYFLRTFRTSN